MSAIRSGFSRPQKGDVIKLFIEKLQELPSPTAEDRDSR